MENDDDDTRYPFPCFSPAAAAAAAEAAVEAEEEEAGNCESPARTRTFSENYNRRIWESVANYYNDCSIFPPNLHEGLHLRSELHQTLALPKREKMEDESGFRVSKPSLISAQRMLSSWIDIIRSKIYDRFGGSGEIVGAGVCVFVALAGIVVFLKRRHRREKEFLMFSIQEKNQKIGLLLHQIAELNAILAAHRRVPVLRKT